MNRVAFTFTTFLDLALGGVLALFAMGLMATGNVAMFLFAAVMLGLAAALFTFAWEGLSS